MKVSHEMPIEMLQKGIEQTHCDYFYALVHLFDDPDIGQYYLNYTIAQLKQGRDVILDNSIFELGVAFSDEKFFDKINIIQKQVSDEMLIKHFWYIVPDVLDDLDKTCVRLNNFLREYQFNILGRRIGVIQGKTESELLQGYMRIAPFVHKVAISFNCEAYGYGVTDNETLQVWKGARRKFIADLSQSLPYSHMPKPIHLLGCAVPDEFKYYTQNKAMSKMIDTIDTSNPVLHGYKDIKYTGDYGLKSKDKTKLADIIKESVSEEQEALICYNMKEFRRINSI